MKYTAKTTGGVAALAILLAGSSFAQQLGTTPEQERQPGQQGAGQAQSSAGQQSAPQQQQAQQQPQQGSQLVDIAKLSGTRVTDSQGNQLGKIEQVLVDSESGRVRYASVMAQDGKEVAVPWQALNVSKQGQAEVKISLNTTKERFDKAPRFSRTEIERLNTRQAAEPVYSYWAIIWVEDATPGTAQTQQEQQRRQQQHQGAGTQGGQTGGTVGTPDQGGSTSAPGGGAGTGGTSGTSTPGANQ